MSFELRAAVRADLGHDRFIEGEVWGKGWNKTAGHPVFDVYEFAAGHWHYGLLTEQLTRLPGDPFAHARTHIAAPEASERRAA